MSMLLCNYNNKFLAKIKNLERSINSVKSLRILWQLRSDVIGAYKDTLKVLPLALHFKPQRYHGVCRAKLLLPRRHFRFKEANKLRGHHILNLIL